MEQRLNLYKFRAKILEKRKKYFENYLKFARLIKKKANHIFGEVKVLVFGSVVKGDYLPNSDIDILIITKNLPQEFFEQVKLKQKLLEGLEENPFQIHLATPQMYQRWYKNFIKDNYLEV